MTNKEHTLTIWTARGIGLIKLPVVVYASSLDIFCTLQMYSLQCTVAPLCLLLRLSGISFPSFVLTFLRSSLSTFRTFRNTGIFSLTIFVFQLQVGLHELGIGLTDLKTGEFESVTSSIEGGHTTTVIETNGDWKQTSSSSGVVTTDLKTEPWDVAERHSETKTVVVTSMAE